jgi:hypothetical protein
MLKNFATEYIERHANKTDALHRSGRDRGVQSIP